MKKLRIIATALLFMSAVTGTAVAQQFPQKNLQGLIMWGAGGGTDNFARSITPIAEKNLGRTVILQNKVGAAGAIATTMTVNAPADGYTLLYGAENPAIFRILGLSPLSFHDLEPIIIPIEGTVVICVNPDTPYKTMQDLIKATEANKKIKMGTSGTGGLPYVAGAMMKVIHGAEFNHIQFDGDGPGATAVMGGHADMMPLALSTSVEYIRSGRLRGLAVLRTERVSQLPDVPAITEIYPEYAKFLPWGPFYGIFVKKGTAPEVVKTLTDAFLKASEDDRFKAFAKNSGGEMINLTGDAARSYLTKFESTASWLVHNAGGSKKSPEEFGIPKP